MTSDGIRSYFGHGGMEQYIRSQKIRNLKTCATTMLWGCSSGILKYMGELDRTGTPHNYMLAGWYVVDMQKSQKLIFLILCF